VDLPCMKIVFFTTSTNLCPWAPAVRPRAHPSLTKSLEIATQTRQSIQPASSPGAGQRVESPGQNVSELPPDLPLPSPLPDF